MDGARIGRTDPVAIQRQVQQHAAGLGVEHVEELDSAPGVGKRRRALEGFAQVNEAEMDVAGWQWNAPLLAVATAVLLASSGEPVRQAIWHHPMIWTFGFLNAALVLFSLRPCLPMDGGRMLRSFLTWAMQRARPALDERARVLATRIAGRRVEIRWPAAR